MEADNSSDLESNDDESTNPGLFLFSSPPKATSNLPHNNTSNNTNGAFRNIKKALIEYDDIKIDKPYSNNTEYNPLMYSKSADETGQLKPPMETLQPRPPSSPKSSSRPGSGRSRIRAGSNTSNTSNTSNKPTPDSSGNGEDLKNHLTNQQSDNMIDSDTVSNKLKPDRHGVKRRSLLEDRDLNTNRVKDQSESSREHGSSPSHALKRIIAGEDYDGW